MAQLFSTARQEIARRAAQFLQGMATGGSTTTVIDANNLTYVDNYWNEAAVLFTSGTNNGLVRKVQTFSSASTQATRFRARSRDAMPVRMARLLPKRSKRSLL